MRWIVLLRGVNVGGHGKTPMAELRQHLSAAGASNVASYIQSGNLIFDHPETDAGQIADWTSDVIDRAFGHRPPALAFTRNELQAMADATPFHDAETPKVVHVHLFRDPPARDALARLSPYFHEGEKMKLGANCLYHWTPQGFGNSKAAQKVPAALGVTTTARNLVTMGKILALA
jgi:uncharacterized protein (DUF1697 family)